MIAIALPWGIKAVLIVLGAVLTALWLLDLARRHDRSADRLGLTQETEENEVGR